MPGRFGWDGAFGSTWFTDPKDKIGVYTVLSHALEEAGQGRLQESNTLLRQALKQDDRLIDAHLNLGVNLAQMGNSAGATAVSIFTS